MRDKDKKRQKRDRNAADVDNGSELKHFAQRNNVSLDEAIEIAKRFGSAESATFINGVLDHVARSKTSRA